jgi:hypothetical protein
MHIWVYDTVMLMDGDEIVDCRHGHVSERFPNCVHTVFGFGKVPRYGNTVGNLCQMLVARFTKPITRRRHGSSCTCCRKDDDITTYAMCNVTLLKRCMDEQGQRDPTGEGTQGLSRSHWWGLRLWPSKRACSNLRNCCLVHNLSEIA